jgi:vacuolar-type H+-ATPase subunit C/Vma6
MMKLLRELTQPDYPADYLAARIKGRKASLIHNWQPYIVEPDKIPSVSDAAIWEKFIHELHWLYAQMNSRLRLVCHGVITFFELRTLFLCLRFMEGGQKKTAIELLAKSLIDRTVQKLFEQETNTSALVRKLLIQIDISGDAAKKLEVAYDNKGLISFEKLLYIEFFTDALRVNSHAAIHSFFKDLIDLRNIMSQAKHIRWRHTQPPDLIPGGLRTDKHSLFKQKKLPAAAMLKSDIQLLETSLLTDLTKKIHRSSRNKGNICVIIDYLWQRYMETKNLGTILNAQNISPDRITQELIQ